MEVDSIVFKCLLGSLKGNTTVIRLNRSYATLMC